ncbi:GNAT family N-acetyltransferase [Arthrobacter sp. Ld5]|uniref:GNAT family N-acetyltransferase n=1 Tax=Arthrobacter sp. Ld5 TaxID=649152 RepID=UPI003EBFD4AD
MTEPSTFPDATGAGGDPALRDVTPGPAGPNDPDVDAVVPPTRRERDAQWLADAAACDVGTASLADLRSLADRMFRLLDDAYPPEQATERYTAAVGEIGRRARREGARADAPLSREVFKDSPPGSRFELFVDGSLGAYLEYSMVGGRLTLRALVEMPGFERRGLGRVLMGRAVLSAHKRRLELVAGCTAARLFLERNPQYRALAHTS